MKLKLLEKSIQFSGKKNYRTKIFGLFFFIMIGFTSAKAQYTAIPDAAFEQGLINQGIDSGVPDGQVLTASISNLTTLSMQGGGKGGSIKDLTGIKDFISLQELFLSYQKLTSLDLSGMTSLTKVGVYSNYLTSINLNGLSNLEELNCGNNALTTLELSGLTNLKNLSCGQNLLTSLNLIGLNNLEAFYCNENKITSLDLGGLTNLTTLNFGSNKITTVNLSALTKLTTLDSYQNQLTDLNVSALTALTYLNCSGNNLRVLDVSNSPDLQYFFCTANPDLTCIIVNNVANANTNAAAEDWGKDATANYSLSCSPFAAANQTFCGGATVANLAATGTEIKWYLNATGGPTLAPSTALVSGNYYASQTSNGIESDRTSVAVVVNTTPLPSRNMAVNGTLCRPSTYATLASKFNNPESIKIYASATSTTPIDTSLEIIPVGTFLTFYITQTINGCESARLTDSQTFVNPNYEPTVTDQTFCARNNPTVANLTATATGGGSNIKWYLSMASVTPMASTRALTTRDYYVTQSAYPCGESPRKKVSVTVNEYEESSIYTCGSYTWPLDGVTYTESGNPTFDDGCVIHYLYLTIAPVDVPVIRSQFRLTGATIADITITQGQSIQWYADAIGGEPLPVNTLLENKTYYATQSQVFSDTNTQCESDRLAVSITLGAIPEGYTFIADERFEQKLINLGYDDVIDNKVLTANIDTVTSLDLTATSIGDLTGIRDFKSLVSLDMIYNSVTHLDLSGLTALEAIRAYGNYLSTVNLTGLKHLKEINFGNSALTVLDLSGLTALEKLEVSGPLTNLDLSDQANLNDLNCRYTKITGLNLKNKPNLVTMNATQVENLTCIIVDDIAAATANTNWTKDAGANYSEGITNVTTESVCDSYTWPVNNVTYTTSGKYTVVNNCNTEELHLTINPTIIINKNITACGSYVWDYNGQTYTETGTYSLVGATPCESATLKLTITPLEVPTFTAVDAIYAGTVLADLPTISNNGITGTWSPALNNKVTTMYTFVPELNTCATQTTLQIIVNPAIDTINPLPKTAIKVTATASQSKVYGATEPVLTYTVTPSLASGDTFTGSLSRVTGENVGTYTIEQGTLSAGSKYTITYVAADFSITKADQQITWSQALVSNCNTSSSTVMTASSTSGLPITYSSSNTNLATVSEGVLRYNDFGSVTITASQLGDANYNSAQVVTLTAVNSQSNLIRQQLYDVIFFDNSSKEFKAYTWYKNGTIVLGQTLQYFKEAGGLNGSYYAVATKTNGTVITTCPLTLSTTVAVETIKIVPNPASSNSSFQLISTVEASKMQNAQIDIFGMNGVLLEHITTNETTTTIKAPVTEGIYIVKLTLSNGKRLTKNLLVKN